MDTSGFFTNPATQQKLKMKIRMLRNKKGTDKYLAIYWFLIVAIVTVGIFGMTYVFYGTPYDVRNVEANLLLNRVADCVSYAGRINTTFISNSQFYQKTGDDFLKECHLNFVSSEWNDVQYYTEVSFYTTSNLNNPVLDIKAGNNNWAADCAIQGNNQQANLPQCVQKSFYSVDDASNQYIIKILTAVAKSEKNVKI